MKVKKFLIYHYILARLIHQIYFLNKLYNLCYGKYLKHLNPDDYSILFVKDQSSIKKVKYNKAIENLWKTTISENEIEDTSIKKINC